MTMLITQRGALARSISTGFTTQMRQAAFSPLAIVMSALSPLAYGVVIISGYGRPDAALLLGCVAAGIWGNLYTQSTLIVLQEKSWGTLQMLAASPVRLSAPLLGRLLACTFQALAAVPVIVITVVALFGEIQHVEPLLFTTALAVVTLGLIGMSLMLMGVLARYKYSAGMVNGLFGIVILLGGFFVPLSALPVVLRALGYTVASSWAVQAARLPSGSRSWTDLLIAGLIAIAWLGMGASYVSGAQRRLRRTGSYGV